MATARTIELVGERSENRLALAERWGVSIWTITNYWQNEGMPAPIKVGRAHYFETQSADRWLSKRK